MKKSVLVFVFVLTIILCLPVSAKMGKGGSTSFTKKSGQQETITFVDSVKPITEKQRKKAIKRAEKIQKRVDNQIRRGRIQPTRRVIQNPRHLELDEVPLGLDIEFAGNVPEEAQEAVLSAFSTVTERIFLDEENEHTTMNVRIIADVLSLGEGVLAVASVTTRSINGASYPTVLANYLENDDQGVQGFDVRITYSWLQPPAPWYYGLEEECPDDEMHFGALMSHELGHGLGFFSRFRVEHGSGMFWGNVPSWYDTYLVDEEGNSIIDNYELGAELAEVLTSGNVFWGGDIPIYSPNPWEPGSSISHYNDDLGLNRLMSPFQSRGQDFNWQAGPFYWRVLSAEGAGWPLTEVEENEPPRWEEFPDGIEGIEGQIISFDFVASDPEEDDLEFSFTSEDLPEGWEIEYNDDGVSGTFIWDRPDFNDADEYILLATVSDGENTEVNREVEIIVRRNRGPIIINPAPNIGVR